MILLSLYDLILVKGLKLDIPLIRVLKSAISLMHLMPLLALWIYRAGFRAFIYKNYTTDRKN